MPKFEPKIKCTIFFVAIYYNTRSKKAQKGLYRIDQEFLFKGGYCIVLSSI
jgi:hypothetical protein